MEFEKIKKIILSVKNIEEDKITIESDFIKDLMLDSIEVFQVIMGIEEEFKIEIKNTDLNNIHTVSDAVKAIERYKNV